jgi:hypothetical protein
MQVIIDFFEYTLSGGIWFIYFILMIIFSLACLGVVGEKVSKRKQEELIAKREALAKAESEKAKDLIKKQAESYAVNNTLDPTAKKAQEAAKPAVPTPVAPVAPVVEPVPEVTQPAVPEVVVFDAPATSVQGPVDNVTPIVDQPSEEVAKTEGEAPSMLVINDDGTSNVSV